MQTQTSASSARPLFVASLLYRLASTRPAPRSRPPGCRFWFRFRSNVRNGVSAFHGRVDEIAARRRNGVFVAMMLVGVRTPGMKKIYQFATKSWSRFSTFMCLRLDACATKQFVASAALVSTCRSAITPHHAMPIVVWNTLHLQYPHLPGTERLFQSESARLGPWHSRLSSHTK